MWRVDFTNNIIKFGRKIYLGWCSHKMKYVIVQVSKFYVCITPAETGKQFVSSGNERNSKRPDYEVTFKEPLVVFLPDNLRSGLEFPERACRNCKNGYEKCKNRN